MAKLAIVYLKKWQMKWYNGFSERVNQNDFKENMEGTGRFPFKEWNSGASCGWSAASWQDLYCSLMFLVHDSLPEGAVYKLEL